MKLESLKMNLKSLKSPVNNEKGQLIKGKIAKSRQTFRKNKPNLPIVQIDVTFFATMSYTFFSSLTEVKSKPNQTQFKANTNPIPERPKMNIRNASTMNYINFPSLLGKKQTQIKPKSNPILLSRKDQNRSTIPGVRGRSDICLLYPVFCILSFYILLEIILINHYNIFT